MTIRSYYSVTIAAVFLAALSIGAAADEKPMHQMGQDAMIDHMVETARTAKDHEEIAKSFDEEAADFEEKAANHERLAKQYNKGAGVGPKGNPAALANHCNRIVKNLRASAEDAREMARLHREVAKSIKP